jgi:hypothetical protein
LLFVSDCKGIAFILIHQILKAIFSKNHVFDGFITLRSGDLRGFSEQIKDLSDAGEASLRNMTANKK